MKIPTQPNDVKIEGDSASEIMRRSGEIIGLTKSRAVWRFGFLYHSDSAKAYGVNTVHFVWILSDHAGKVLDEYHGFAIDLPPRFRAIINGSFNG